MSTPTSSWALPCEGLAATYDDLKVIAAGGTGIVFSAVHHALQRKVAIKLLLPERMVHVTMRERALREARAMARVQHPNVVRVYNAGAIRLTYGDIQLLIEGLHALGMSAVFPEKSQTVFIEMEWVEGGTLQDFIAQGQPLVQVQAASAVLDLLAALEAVHLQGIVHRDVKPANIMLTEDGDVKLTDFGLVNSQDAELTRVGTQMGTPGYMPPEQDRDAKSAGVPADLYAVAVTFHCLLRGRDPVGATRPGVLAPMFCDIVQRQKDDPNDQKFANFWRSMGDPLKVFILKATDRDPDARFKSAATMAEALREIKSDLLVSLSSPETLVAVDLDSEDNSDTFPIDSDQPWAVDEEEDMLKPASDDDLPWNSKPKRSIHWLVAVAMLILVIGVGALTFTPDGESATVSIAAAPDLIEPPVEAVTPPVPEPAPDLVAALVQPETVMETSLMIESKTEPEPERPAQREAEVRAKTPVVKVVQPDPMTEPKSEVEMLARITVEGDATRVWLGGTKLPASPPPGYYHIYAEFSDGERRQARSQRVQVLEGVPMIIKCSANAGACVAK